MRQRWPKRITQRDVKNALIGLDALANGTTPQFEETKTRSAPRRQEESKVNDAGKAWARTRGGELYRNSRGMMPTPNGGMRPYGVGPNGAGDLLGPFSIIITPEFVGRRIAVYAEFESKTETGRLAEHQVARIEHLRDIGAIAGCARNAQDFEDIFQRWMRR